MRSTLSCAAFFGSTVHALALWAPKETLVATIRADALSPRPTLPPSFQGLRKRQSSSSDTFLIGPDRTCGFISGLPGAGFACDAATDTCVLVPSTSATAGFVGCCDDQDCGFRVTCLDYNQISSSSLCDNGCMVDTFTAKCTESTAAFCNTVSFSGDIFDYFCNSLNISTPQLARTTYDGETDGRAFTTTVFADDSSTDLPTTSSKSSRSTSLVGLGSSSSPGLSASSASSGPTTTPTTSGGGGKSSTPIGAIVGGVVGGVAVIAIVALGIVFLLRRRNAPAPAPQPAAPQPPTTPAPAAAAAAAHQSFYGGPPGGDPAKHNGGAANGQQPPMVQSYPTPPPPFAAQPYAAPNSYQNPGSPPPPSAGEYNGNDSNRFSTAAAMPVSPSTTMASHQSYHQGFGQGQGQPQVPGTVHEIGGEDNHRGTMSELG